MTLQLLHRRGGGTFGQTEREAGMKQKLLTQVRIDHRQEGASALNTPVNPKRHDDILIRGADDTNKWLR